MPPSPPRHAHTPTLVCHVPRYQYITERPPEIGIASSPYRNRIAKIPTPLHNPIPVKPHSPHASAKSIHPHSLTSHSLVCHTRALATKNAHARTRTINAERWRANTGRPPSDPMPCTESATRGRATPKTAPHPGASTCTAAAWRHRARPRLPTKSGALRRLRARRYCCGTCGCSRRAAGASRPRGKRHRPRAA